ncbi:hypothetical protein QRO11_15470 [Paracidovorax citrulli]|uniref:hypothetical protein n=1 Tax=Paracidovorax citrulli TaxID=80869 RepID=UPI001113AAA6|nr:hypothetical protein [Paracidovorax citrulli]UMT87773.1 hypothetical protein FRC90_06605 [Paracidovorax citrulli]WIY33348.1 hypothetical protein QRO11_15470 [Paracidovorax citrulli]
MRKLWCCTGIAALALLGENAHAFNLSCAVGAKCINSQGTSIPSKQVLEMMERCSEFTAGGVGRQVLKLSIHEIIQRSGKNPGHPLYSAYYAFNELYDSPLRFDRKADVGQTSYEQIARSCQQLERDFDRWAQ